MEELIGPFRGERERRIPAAPWGGSRREMRCRSPRWRLSWRSLQPRPLMTRVGIVYHLMFLGLAGGLHLPGVLLKRIRMQKIQALLVRTATRGVPRRRCTGWPYPCRGPDSQATREQFCGLYTAKYAMALGYMGRFEEARVLAGRLLRCELTPLEEMGCQAVLAFCHYHHGRRRRSGRSFKPAPGGEHVRRQWPALSCKTRSASRNLSRVRSQEGAGAAYRLCLEAKSRTADRFTGPCAAVRWGAGP